MKRSLCLLWGLLSMCGCGPNSADLSPRTTPNERVQALLAQRHVRQAVVEGNTAFAVDLYRQLRTSQGNLCFSPYSISTALAMTYAGARGETERQMAKALHFTLPQDTLHPAFAELEASLGEAQQKGSVELLVANSLWPQEGLSLRKGFLEVMEANYKTLVTALDYHRTEEARQTINRWVEDKTRNKIKELIQAGVLDPTTVLVLANAIYFKGAWLNPFDKNLTRGEPFHLTATKTITTPMMTHPRLECGYYADAEVQVLEIPYVGKQISMLMILPRQVDGIAKLERGLNATKLTEWANKWGVGDYGEEVIVSFPKFRLASYFSLEEALKALGMVNAFGGGADFSGMFGTRGPSISAVLHKAFVEVNEEGTEAAAATGVMMTIRANPGFRADHPFLFLIRDRRTGSVLFMGRVLDPRLQG
jgi:serpin B